MATKFKSLKGQLLLDAGGLGGSIFQRSVVLVCDHDAKGAFGLILNRPLEGTVGSAIAAHLPDTIKDQPLHVGGPVQPTALSFLWTEGFMTSANVLDNVSVGHDLQQLQDIGSSFAPALRVRVFGGYSGWSAGQLEDEMKRGSWITHPASAELVFDPEQGGALWRRILTSMGWQYKLVADAPEDPSLN